MSWKIAYPPNASNDIRFLSLENFTTTGNHDEDEYIFVRYDIPDKVLVVSITNGEEFAQVYVPVIEFREFLTDLLEMTDDNSSLVECT